MNRVNPITKTKEEDLIRSTVREIMKQNNREQLQYNVPLV